MRSGKMAIAMAVMGMASMASASTILMHLGSGGTATDPAGRTWNQIGAGNGVANAAIPLNYTDGTASGVSYFVAPGPTATLLGAPLAGTQVWANPNSNGAVAGQLPGTSAAVLRGYAGAAFSKVDSSQYGTNAAGFQGNGINDVLITLSGLAPSTAYNVYFYADRNGGGQVRSGAYALTGASTSTVVYDAVADGNLGNVGTFASAVTDATGTFKLDMKPDASNTNANGFFYLSALEIESAVPEPASLALVGIGSLALLKRRRD